MVARIPIPEPALSDFCRRNHIRRLALFGSVLRDDFGPDSDVDVLVEFEDGHVPGLMSLAGMGDEMSNWFGGRYVDLKTTGCFRPATLEKILSEAKQYYGPPFGRPGSVATHARGGRKGASPRKKKQTG